MKIDLEVTDEDIKAGRPKMPSYCPVACAVRRKYPGLVPYVSGTIISITGPLEKHFPITEATNRSNFQDVLPMEVRNFIRLFDNHEPVDPISFSVVGQPY